MAEEIKTGISATVDVDLAAGRVDSTKFEAGVKQAVETVAKELKGTKEFPVNAKLNTKPITDAIAQAKAAIHKEYAGLFKGLGEGIDFTNITTSKSRNLPDILKAKLDADFKSASGVIKNKVSLQRAELEELFGKEGKAHGGIKKGVVGQLINSVVGKTEADALTELGKHSVAFKAAIADRIRQMREALDQVKAFHAEADKLNAKFEAKAAAYQAGKKAAAAQAKAETAAMAAQAAAVKKEAAELQEAYEKLDKAITRGTKIANNKRSLRNTALQEDASASSGQQTKTQRDLSNALLGQADYLNKLIPTAEQHPELQEKLNAAISQTLSEWREVNLALHNYTGSLQDAVAALDPQDKALLGLIGKYTILNDKIKEIQFSLQQGNATGEEKMKAYAAELQLQAKALGFLSQHNQSGAFDTQIGEHTKRREALMADIAALKQLAEQQRINKALADAEAKVSLTRAYQVPRREAHIAALQEQRDLMIQHGVSSLEVAATNKAIEEQLKLLEATKMLVAAQKLAAVAADGRQKGYIDEARYLSQLKLAVEKYGKALKELEGQPAYSSKFTKARKELEEMQETLKDYARRKGLPDLIKANGQYQASLDRLVEAEKAHNSLASNSSVNERIASLKQLQRAHTEVIASYTRMEAAEKAHFEDSSKGKPYKPADTDENRKAFARFQASQKAIHDLNSEMQGLDSVLARVSQALGLFFRYAVLYQSLYAMVGAIQSAIKEIFDLQNALIQIKAISGATNSEMKKISAAVRDVAESTAFTSTEVAKGGQILVQAGVELKDFGATLKSVSDLAQSTGSTFEQSAEVMTTFLAVFDSASPAKLADELRNAVNISKLTIADLSTISNYILESGKSFGLNEKTLLAASATLRDAGIKASTIGTGLRQVINEGLSPDTKALKALEKRYAEMGENLSQETIKAMYQGFQQAKDPLEALLNELERIGYNSVGKGTLDRMYEVRAENVLKALLQQRSAFEKNKVLIDENGTAAKGAKTQLESFETALQNLGETLKGIGFTTAEEGIDKMTHSIHEASDAVGKLAERLTDLKAQTGSTGLGDTALTGAEVTGAALAGRVSIGKSLGLGAITTVIEAYLHSVGNVSAATEMLAKTITSISTVFAGAAFIKFLGGQYKNLAAFAATQVAEISAAALALKVGWKGAAAAGIGAAANAHWMPDAMAASNAAGAGAVAATGFKGVWEATKKLVPVALRLSILIGGLYSLFDYITNRWSDAADAAKSKADAYAEKIQTQSKKVEEIRNKRRESLERGDSLASLKNTVNESQEFNQRFNSPAAEGILSRHAETSTAVGSKGLEQVVEEMRNAGVVTNQADIIGGIQKANKAIQAAEATRAQYAKAVADAYSALKKDQEDKSALAIVDAWQGLDTASKQKAQTHITTLEQARGLIDSSAKHNALLDSINGVINGAQAVYAEEAKQADLIAKEVGEQLKELQAHKNQARFLKDRDERPNRGTKFLLYFGASDKDLKSDKGYREYLDKAEGAQAGIKSKLITAVNEGEVLVVESIVKAVEKALAAGEITEADFNPAELKQALATARKNAMDDLLKPFEAAIKEAESHPIERQKPATTADELNARHAELRAKAPVTSPEDEEVLRAAVIKAQEAALKFAEDTKAFAEAHSKDADIAEVMRQKHIELQGLQDAAKRQESKLAEIHPDIQPIAEKLKDLEGALVPIIAKRKDAEEYLASIANEEIYNAEKILDQTQALYKAKEDELELTRKAAEANLKNAPMFRAMPIEEITKFLDSGTEESKRILQSQERVRDSYEKWKDTVREQSAIPKQREHAINQVYKDSASQRMAALERSQLPLMEDLKQARLRLKDAVTAQLKDVNKEVGLAKDVYEIEQQIAHAQKEKAEQALREQLAHFEPKLPQGNSVSELLQVFKDNPDLLASHASLADAYKSLREAIDKESDARDHAATEVDNIRRRQVAKDQKHAQAEFNKAQAHTSSLESKLQTATSNLTSAREHLAEITRKIEESHEHYTEIKRQLEGKPTTALTLRSDLKDAQDSGDVKVAKHVQDETLRLFQSGELNKFSASGILDEAQKVIEDVENQEKAQAEANVIYATQTQAALMQAVEAAKASQDELKEHLDSLTEAVENLDKSVKGEVAGWGKGKETSVPPPPPTEPKPAEQVFGQKSKLEIDESGKVVNTLERAPLDLSPMEVPKGVQPNKLYPMGHALTEQDLRVLPDVPEAVVKADKFQGYKGSQENMWVSFEKENSKATEENTEVIKALTTQLGAGVVPGSHTEGNKGGGTYALKEGDFVGPRLPKQTSFSDNKPLPPGLTVGPEEGYGVTYAPDQNMAAMMQGQELASQGFMNSDALQAAIMAMNAGDEEGSQRLVQEAMTPITALANPAVSGNDYQMDYSNGVGHFAEGGPVEGLGDATSDSNPALLSKGEFVEPAKVVSTYGEDFMNKLRNLQIDPTTVAAFVNPMSLESNPMTKVAASKPQTFGVPVHFHLGDANIAATASQDALDNFQAMLRLQAVKTGRKL